MADRLAQRIAASFGTRQAAVVQRMRSAAALLQQHFQEQIDKLAASLQRNVNSSPQTIARIVANILADLIEKTPQQIETQLLAVGQWGYQSAVDALLGSLSGEQLSWIAWSRINGGRGSTVQEADDDGGRFTINDAIELKKKLALNKATKDNLVNVSALFGTTGSATLIQTLLNAYPSHFKKGKVVELLAAKLQASGGNVTPNDLKEIADLGTGKLQLGAPESLADWWAQGFHELPEGRKREVLKQFVFDPPTTAKVKQWTQAPANVFGQQSMTWEDRLQTISKLIADPNKLSSTIANEMAAGKGVYGVMQAILPQVNSYKVSAQRIARMEVNRVCAQANEEVFSDCGDIIDGYQINAVLDVVTRPEHASRHGTIYSKDEDRPSLPDDYNCRCYYSAVLKPPKGISENPTLLQQFETEAGPVMDPLVYSQWWAKASEGERQAVVGVKRYKAIESKLGSVPQFEDFIDEKGALRSISALQKATAQEVSAWRSTNQEKFMALAQELTEVRRKSFLTPAHPAPLPPAPKGPDVQPLPKFPPGWSKVTTTSKSGKTKKPVYVGPDGKQYKTLKDAKAAVNAKVGPPPVTKPLNVPPPPPTPAAPGKPPARADRAARRAEARKDQHADMKRLVSTKTGPIKRDRPTGFPVDPTELKEVRKLGGSTGAVLVEDAAGNRFVMKRGANADHIREEFAAEEVYRAAGVNVPTSHLYEDGHANPIKLSKYVEGETLANVHGKVKEKAKAQLADGFATDALLGNWDVVGAAADNVIVDKDGTVWRVDVGGSMRFRAQGMAKTERDWNDYPTELWSLKQGGDSFSTSRAEFFAGVSHADRVKQMRSIVKQKEAILKAANDENRETLAARIEQMADLIHVDDTLSSDTWSESYRDSFTQHTLGIRNARISDQLPEEMKQKKPGMVDLVDENGDKWDWLRGKNSVTASVEEYVESTFGKDSYRQLDAYFGRQAVSSWNDEPQAFKVAILKARGLRLDEMFWATKQDVYANYSNVASRFGGEEKFAKVISAYHAFAYESLRKVKVPYKHPGKDAISLVRTHKESNMAFLTDSRGKRVNHVTNSKDLRIKQGGLESCSLTNYVVVSGHKALHYPEVPLHRIFCWYGMGRSSRENRILMGNSENEFVAHLHGLACDYVGDIASGAPRKEAMP